MRASSKIVLDVSAPSMLITMEMLHPSGGGLIQWMILFLTMKDQAKPFYAPFSLGNFARSLMSTSIQAIRFKMIEAQPFFL